MDCSFSIPFPCVQIFLSRDYYYYYYYYYYCSHSTLATGNWQCRWCCFGGLFILEIMFYFCRFSCFPLFFSDLLRFSPLFSAFQDFSLQKRCFSAYLLFLCFAAGFLLYVSICFSLKNWNKHHLNNPKPAPNQHKITSKPPPEKQSNSKKTLKTR